VDLHRDTPRQRTSLTVRSSSGPPFTCGRCLAHLLGDLIPLSSREREGGGEGRERGREREIVEGRGGGECFGIIYSPHLMIASQQFCHMLSLPVHPLYLSALRSPLSALHSLLSALRPPLSALRSPTPRPRPSLGILGLCMYIWMYVCMYCIVCMHAAS
jgi:hypothetical protein